MRKDGILCRVGSVTLSRELGSRRVERSSIPGGLALGHSGMPCRAVLRSMLCPGSSSFLLPCEPERGILIKQQITDPAGARQFEFRWQLGWWLTPAAWHLEGLGGFLPVGGGKFRAVPGKGRVPRLNELIVWQPRASGAGF